MKRSNDTARTPHLKEAERAAWEEVTRSVKPLRQKAVVASGPVPRAPPAATPPGRLRSTAPAAPLASFDRGQRKRLARGTVPLDGSLDLHGQTQTQAHALLLRFLRRAQSDGARFVLVVTGKGATRDHAGWGAPAPMGVLRRQVPLWLELPEFRTYVSACEPADMAHGGEGALYIRIRRRRD